MFTAFQNGQVDITDWPIQAPDLNTFCPNVDIWCSSPQPEFGIFQADINNHAPFLGQIMETSRPALVGSVTTTVASAGCAVGFGQMTLNVVNIENNTQPFKDSLNTITISNQPSGSPNATVSDSGGSSPTGTYKFPCILAGTYLLSSTMVTGNATTGTHLGCGAIAGCTISIPSNLAASTTWNVVWNSPSTLTPTATFPNIMKALAHLIDKPEFVQHDTVLQGHASCDDTMLAPAHLIQGSPCVTAAVGQPGSPFPAAVLTRECSNLTFDAIITSCNPISAYNLVDDNIGSGAIWWGVPGRTARGSVAVGYSGPSDIDAACQYLQRAGFSLTPSGSTCAQLAQATVGTIQPGTYPHFTAPAGTHFVVLLRTDPPMAHFGQVIADSINMLFGTPNDSGTCPTPCTQTSTGTAAVIYYTAGAALQPTAAYNNIRVAVPIVFGDGGTGGADKWNLYTGGTSLGSTPDSLFSNYHSRFASTVCGGAPNLFPSDYDFHCDPQFDAISNAGEFQSISGPILSGSVAVFQQAAARLYDSPGAIAMYSRIHQFAELNGWNWQSIGGGTSSSLVVQKGHGTQTGFWSLLNMRQVPGYTPANSIYTPGGGNPNLIRRGFSQDPDTVNPYQANTIWDFEIISQVFDTMLQVNPETGGPDRQVIEWMTTDHNATFNPNEIGCIAGPSVAATTCVKGITTQTWHLRNDLFFHDGTPVTAQDVVYSILTQRDVPSANGFPSVAFVTNAIVVNAQTVQVKLESNSAYYELNIGGVPIVPRNLWGPVCGSISSMSTPGGPVNVVTNGPSSECADPSFDPVTCVGTAGPVAGCGHVFADGSVQGIFVGSGPRVCNNIGPSTSQAFGKAGGSCIQSSAGLLIGGTQMSVDSRVLLTADFNYMRVTRGQGDSWQKFNWADVTDDGVVDILDAANMAFFFDSTNAYWSHPRYTCNNSGVVDICVASALVILFDKVLSIPPFASNQLVNLDPQIDRYNMQLTGSTPSTGVCLYYQITNTAATRLALANCGRGGADSLPAGHTITGSAVILNPDGSLGTVQSGSVSISAGAVTNSWSPSLVSGSHYLVRFFDNGVQIGLFYAIP